MPPHFFFVTGSDQERVGLFKFGPRAKKAHGGAAFAGVCECVARDDPKGAQLQAAVLVRRLTPWRARASRRCRHIYLQRLLKLRPALAAAVRGTRLVEKLIALKPGDDNVAVIGTLYKNQKLKPTSVSPIAASCAAG